MAEQPVTSGLVSAEKLAAGLDYLVELRGHGLQPEALTWAWNRERDEPALVLVTSLVDRVGPEAVHRALFDAFDRAVTPAAIDPWVVDVYSPDTIFAETLEQALGRTRPSIPLIAGKYDIVADWIYVRPQSKPKAPAQLAGWRRFQRRVQTAMAA